MQLRACVSSELKKQITSKWKIREASKIKAKLMIVTVLFALRPFCDNKRYFFFFFFWTGCNHLHSSLWNTNYVFKLYHLILKYFNFTDRILSGATAWQSILYGSFGISKKTSSFFSIDKPSQWNLVLPVLKMQCFTQNHACCPTASTVTSLGIIHE